MLALSVLAAYRMHTDEDATGNAYYLRLAELLDCDRVGVYPRGFDPRVFESLWRFLGDSLARESGNQLAFPRGDVGIRRFVALPLSHVPLRRLDIERLPMFFSWADYQPGIRLDRRRLTSDFVRWVAARGALSPAGQCAVGDERREAVIAQVAAELEAWDGSMPESAGSKTANVELTLDIIRNRPELSYLPRRPSGFPPTFDDGVRLLEAGEAGWYDTLPLSRESGVELADGFSWNTRLNGATLSLRRRGMVAIPLAPSADYSGFLSAYGLPKGVACSVLCQESASQAVAEFLSAAAERNCVPIQHSNLPDGWQLFSNVKLRRSLQAPYGLEALEIRSGTELIFSGGLRLGRRLAWVEGAPPKVFVSGDDGNETVTVDGQFVDVDDGGMIRIDHHLAIPGIHVIAIGRTRRVIEIVRPTISTSVLATTASAVSSAVALPQGTWQLVGAHPDQVATCSMGEYAPTIWRGSFEPVWAVRSNAGPGAVVFALQDKPTLPLNEPSTRDRGKALKRKCDYWASVIYGAHVRHPELRSPSAGLDPASAAESWNEYVHLARMIKRSRRGRN
ncbi:hypothetical protein QQ054_15010 [Oscillatoria amoena NRMC-F 0135]|nr:hypothetical protein [Oscillatoria amoena NRMC-F 0135]